MVWYTDFRKVPLTGAALYRAAMYLLFLFGLFRVLMFYQLAGC